MDSTEVASTGDTGTVEVSEITKTVEQETPEGAFKHEEMKEQLQDQLEKLDGVQEKAEELLPTSEAPFKEEELKVEILTDIPEPATSTKPPTDAEICEELLKYLQEDSFNLNITERQLRNRLEEHFGLPLKDRKAIIRDKIMEFIETQQAAEEAVNGTKSGEDEVEGDETVVSDNDEEDEPVKKKRRGGGGLNASCRLSEALQTFLGEESMSRPQVVKALWTYIKANELQDPTNKRKIILDDKLATLFTKPLDMFNMNRQLSKHVKTNDAPEEEEEGSDGGAPPKSAARPKRKSEASASKSAKKAKKSSSDTPKKPSAFTRPLKVSPELSAWLGGDTEISRPQLTKRFWDYAKEKDLLDPSNKKMIICDEALKSLTGEETFQCFSFAKYFKQHLLGFADRVD